MEKGGGEWDVVMVGSSPLESFRGTMLTETFPGGDLIKKVYETYFVERHRSNVSYSSHVLAISGTGNCFPAVPSRHGLGPCRCGLARTVEGKNKFARSH